MSGNKYEGSFIGTPDWSSGEHGHSIYLNGINEAIQTNIPTQSVVTEEFTIITSLKPNRATNWQRAVSKSGVVEIIDYSNSIILRVYTSGGNYSVQHLSPAFSTDKYHILAVTYDGTYINFWIDGEHVEVDDATCSGALTSNSNNWEIGRESQAGGDYWQGYCEYFYIWNRALSASEAALLYREPFCMFRQDTIELWAAATQGGGAPPGLSIPVAMHHYSKNLRVA